ncbi:MAG: pyridine nucleotide-disulfide oxidoreductase, partial [Firmicutes bacterium]|nr:pyridine nucleotide-disulfide oxidoreductase [Bacillota bacterium]
MGNAKTAPATCTSACPAGVDVPRYVTHIREGDFGRALAVIREKIPFPGVCGYVCVHPCESRCARVQYDEPVAIKLLKRAASEYGNESAINPVRPAPTGKKAAVVGA